MIGQVIIMLKVTVIVGLIWLTQWASHRGEELLLANYTPGKSFRIFGIEFDKPISQVPG